MTRLLLIRHAHVDTGPGPGRLCGWLDLPLSARGEQQVADLPRRELARERPDALYTSTLRRARDVGTALAGLWNLSPHALDAVREIHCGELEGVPLAELARDRPDLISRNQAQTDDDFTWPGGESYRQLRARVVATFSEIAARHPAQCVAVVTHAGVISQVLGILKGRPAAAWEPDRPPPLSVTEVIWANGAPSAVVRFASED